MPSVGEPWLSAPQDPQSTQHQSHATSKKTGFYPWGMKLGTTGPGLLQCIRELHPNPALLRNDQPGGLAWPGRRNSMRFTKFGKALAMCALAACIIFGAASCVESYSVGFLYVIGTITAQSGNDGIISGFKIDHNTGRLATINTLPVSSGGANPVRAVLTLGSRFLYVLNRGVNASGNGDCYGVGDNACQNASIQLFAVGGNGTLTQQGTGYFSQGINPFRMIVDTSGNYLMVLDHDAPDNLNPSSTDNCALALGTLGTGTTVTTCADVTVFKIDSTSGRLSLVVNQQVTAANGAAIPYFPVPANPVDFVLSNGYVLTLTGAPTPSSFPYVGGTEVWPYLYSATAGQLTLSQNGLQPMGITAGTAIVAASGVVYVLDNEPVTVTCPTETCPFSPNTYPGQILPWSVVAGGAMEAEPSGVIPDDLSLQNPIQLLLESKGKFLYVANQGNNVSGPNPESGIAGYSLTASPYQLQFISGEPFGSGSGPQCIVEDPSDQYIYEANQYDSTVTGAVLNPSTGILSSLHAAVTYGLQGPPTWCLIDGRTG
jgi:6-phosphogluconolactonase (cycloisomerase 2 family)